MRGSRNSVCQAVAGTGRGREGTISRRFLGQVRGFVAFERAWHASGKPASSSHRPEGAGFLPAVNLIKTPPTGGRLGWRREFNQAPSWPFDRASPTTDVGVIFTNYLSLLPLRFCHYSLSHATRARCLGLITSSSSLRSSSRIASNQRFNQRGVRADSIRYVMSP